jgi:hypothetical protein
MMCGGRPRFHTLFSIGGERAHKKPKKLYKQTNKRVSNYGYMRSLIKRAQVRMSNNI